MIPSADNRPLRPCLCLYLLPAVLLLTAAFARGQEEAGNDSVDLRPLWEDGQSARYEVRTTRVSNSTNQDGQRQTRTIDLTTELTWSVTDAAEGGGGTVSMSIDDMELSLTADGETLEVTADRAPEPLEPLRDLIRAFTSRAVTVEVDADGRVTGVDGWRAIQRDAGNAGEALTEADFIEMASEIAPLAGGQPRAPGATWTEPFTFTHEFGEMNLTSEYTFAGVEQIAGAPVAMVNRESEIEFKIDRQRTGMDQSNDDFSIDWRANDAEQSAQIMFDLSRHEVVGMNLDRSLAFEINTRFGDRSETTRMTEQLNTQVLRLAEE